MSKASDYKVVGHLGKGAYGDVALGQHKTTAEKVAIKVINIEEAEDDIDDIQKEIQVLAELHCDQVIAYKASFMSGNELWLVMELMDGGSLLDLIEEEPLPEPLVAYVMHQVLLGLAYLHTNNMIHRDIKADNILVNSLGHVKIGDFGETGKLTQTMDKRNTVVGSPYWMAPEVIQESNYDSSADVWSVGITCIELANGEAPLMHIHPMRVLFLIPTNPPPTLEGDQFSKAAKSFVQDCLQKETTHRPKCLDLVHHPFIKNHRTDTAGTPAMLALVQTRLQQKKNKKKNSNQGSDSEGSSSGSSSGSDSDSGGDSDNGNGNGDGKETTRRGGRSKLSTFDEDSDQDGKGGGGGGGGSSSSDDDDDWDFESRKFTKQELKEAMAKEQTLADDLQFGNRQEELNRVHQTISSLAQSASASVVPPTTSPNPPTAPTPLLPLPTLLPLQPTSTSFSNSSSSSSSSNNGTNRTGPPLGVHFYDAVIQPSMDGLLSTINQDSLHFGDVTAALSHLRGAFEQLNACGEHEGQLTSALMARIFSEAQRSPYVHVRNVYESPSDSASGRAVVSGQVHKDVAAARNVAKALLAREEQ